MKGWTYSRAGVNIEETKKGQDLMRQLLPKTFRPKTRAGAVLLGPGHYSGIVRINKELCLAIHTDGVGTKVLIAQMVGKYDTIGIDCVAMNVNDVICVGAEPIAFVDYLAMNRADENLVKEITKGLVKGAKEAGVSIVGGETAILPEMITGAIEGTVFDLAGTVAGIVKKQEIIGGNAEEGHVILGAESSGIHSNGLTLARKVLLRKYKLNDRPGDLEKSMGEELLVPTRIYVKPVLSVLKKCTISGLAHVTGGGFTKLVRILKKDCGLNLDMMPKSPPIFSLIQETGGISEKEMYRTFNMGIGFCIAAPRGEEDSIIREFSRHRIRVKEIGRVKGEPGIFIKGQRIG